MKKQLHPIFADILKKAIEKQPTKPEQPRNREERRQQQKRNK
jgi:hypothetical protein